MGAAINVRGIREGVLITLGTGDVPELTTRLAELVESRQNFFRGGRVALQVGDLELRKGDIQQLRQVFEDRGVTMWAVIGTNPNTCAAASTLNLETTFPEPSHVQRPVETPLPDFAEGTGILVNRTIRSGQSVSHEGHVVIIGDVNPGAEVIAGGDVIVWGHLRGTVHAGAMGDQGCSVCALDLSPTQLRIGNHIARPPDGRHRPREVRPERAFVNNGQIVAERWR
jgi:septum site-determining protein MinC